MLHSVLPPALLPTVESVQTAHSLPSAGVTQFNLTADTDTGIQDSQEKSERQGQTPQTSSTAKTENAARLLTPVNAVKTLASPNAPTTFPSEFSSLSVSNSAASLGQPQAVGYPMQQVKGFELDEGSTANVVQIAPSATHRKNLFAPQTQVVAEQSTPPQQQSHNSAQPSLTSIKFSGLTADSGTNSEQVNNIIEFKPRSSTNKPATTNDNVEFQLQPQQNQQPAVRQRVVEVISDRQEYDEQRRIVTAEGNVVVRFDGAVVDADRLQVNLDNLIAVGEGNVALTRGDQVLRGQRFTYNFVQDSGELFNGRGEINIPAAQTDFAFLPTDVTAGGVPARPPSDRIRANQPVTGVSSPGQIDFVFGGTNASNLPQLQPGGEVNRVRFEAAKIDFYPRGWQARNVRLTNDPFSPPELELRADKVTLTREAPLIDRVNTQRQRLVFDQNLTLPLPIDERTIDRREREVTPLIVSPGFDGDKRGGLFIERGFSVINTDQASFSLTPQFFIQKAVQESTGDIASLFGLRSRLNAALSPKTTLQGSAELTSFDFNKVDQNLRASLRLRQTLGDVNPYTLNWEYSYRDRLYNGTLGFQTVQSSLGGVITSPIIPLGKSGISLSYQAGAQYINANTDRQDLLEPNRKNDRISLGRFQSSVALSTGLSLWEGKALPATPTQGLRYTPNPVVPYLRVIAGVTGTSSYYTNGDTQSTLIGTIGLLGQFGNFSRPFLDYTAIDIRYSQGLNNGLSPFLFDRSVDNRVLSAGISQQIYGPLRLGFQTSINLDTGQESSTEYIMEYSRRTYGITFRYNPVLEIGGFSIRISDFNWSGGTDPFSNGDVKPVVGGVQQGN